MKFGQLVIRKIIKIIAARCHILKLKCTKFDSRWCPFVRLLVCVLHGVWHLLWYTYYVDDKAFISVMHFICDSLLVQSSFESCDISANPAGTCFRGSDACTGHHPILCWADVHAESMMCESITLCHLFQHKTFYSR